MAKRVTYEISNGLLLEVEHDKKRNALTCQVLVGDDPLVFFAADYDVWAQAIGVVFVALNDLAEVEKRTGRRVRPTPRGAKPRLVWSNPNHHPPLSRDKT